MRESLLFTIFVLKCILNSQTIEVDTPLGKILGSTLTTRLGKTIYAFRGIRFAEAPINNLRFKDPVPVRKKWSGVYNGTTDGPACSQPAFPVGGEISEDCLFLNVYTTKLVNKTEPNPKRPVIIYIYAGGFSENTGRSDWTGPQFIMDHDIVFVTINYRLASLGFLATGTTDAPGNSGFKDQVVAMRWVKDYIKSFGGDPDSITLWGYSAGSCSVTLHLVSPMSQGLFHKAIFSSCSALIASKLPDNQIDLAKKQAQFVGCPYNTSKNIVDCLRTKSAQELAETDPQFLEFANNPVLIWFAVIEKNFGQERFLIEQPIKSFATGNFHKMPMMGGVTHDEFALQADAFENNTLLKELSDDFEKYAPICFIYERGTKRSKRISRGLRQFYLGDEPLTSASLSNIGKIYADALTGFPTNRLVDLSSRTNTHPVYYYIFTYIDNVISPSGVYHGEDLIYLIYFGAYSFLYNSSFPNPELIEKMTLLWTNFAKYGSPTPDENSNSSAVLGNLDWKPYNVKTKKYLDIGEKLVVREDAFSKRYAFWRELIPISSYYWWGNLL